MIDFSKVKTSDLRILRQELKKSGNPMLVIKKRLLNLLFKDKGWSFDELRMNDFKTSVGAVFASNLESAASSAYKFFSGLEKGKKINPLTGGVKILGGYDLTKKEFIPQERAIFIGKLPPREILLAQLLGMIAAPIRSFLYVLDQKAKRA